MCRYVLVLTLMLLVSPNAACAQPNDDASRTAAIFMQHVHPKLVEFRANDGILECRDGVCATLLFLQLQSILAARTPNNARDELAPIIEEVTAGKTRRFLVAFSTSSQDTALAVARSTQFPSELILVQEYGYCSPSTGIELPDNHKIFSRADFFAFAHVHLHRFAVASARTCPRPPLISSRVSTRHEKRPADTWETWYATIPSEEMRIKGTPKNNGVYFFTVRYEMGYIPANPPSAWSAVYIDYTFRPNGRALNYREFLGTDTCKGVANPKLMQEAIRAMGERVGGPGADNASDLERWSLDQADKLQTSLQNELKKRKYRDGQ